jgi:hypothetical protein
VIFFQAFVHVSTAYSNSYQPEIDEVTYAPQYDPNVIIELSQALPDELLDKVLKFSIYFLRYLVFTWNFRFNQH